VLGIRDFVACEQLLVAEAPPIGAREEAITAAFASAPSGTSRSESLVART